ncbi:MAG: DUF1542 domain-containing protein [Anaerolineales bacterium]|nr:DUF1542 domain-containing protein [Anaerolineales bacterium]
MQLKNFFQSKKSVDFLDELDNHEGIDVHLLIMPDDREGIDLLSVSQLFSSIHRKIESVLFLGFLATQKVAFFYIASKTQDADIVVQEITTLFPKLRFEKVSYEDVLDALPKSETVITGVYLLGQMEEDVKRKQNKWWRPIKTLDKFRSDPFSSLFSSVKGLREKEFIWWYLAIQPHSAARASPMYQELVKMYQAYGNSADADGSLRASITKLEYPQFLAQMYIVIEAENEKRFEKLLSAIESYMEQFTEFNSISLSEGFYKTFPLSPATTEKLIEVVVKPAVIRLGKENWMQASWMALSSAEVGCLWHIPSANLGLPEQLIQYTPEKESFPVGVVNMEVNQDFSNSHIEGSNITGQAINSTITTNTYSSRNQDVTAVLAEVKKAIEDSKHLSKEKKDEYVDMVNKIKDEAEKPKPNKTFLKLQGEFLLATLKAVPDLAKAVTALAPLISKLLL